MGVAGIDGGSPTTQVFPLRDALIVSALSVLPRNQLARGMGWLARVHLPGFLNRWLIRWYIRHYRVDMSVCDDDISHYPTLSDFFVRRLKPGARPLCGEPQAIVSPSDSRVHAHGRVCKDQIPQGGHKTVNVSRLLGGEHPFEGGEFLILYLSPPDYHRVHAPCAGSVYRWQYIPGRLFPVFPACAERVEGLFGRNERLVMWMDTAGRQPDIGKVGVVMVGAFGVGRITTPFTDLISNTGQVESDVLPADPPVFQRGDELGVFHLGSTVILFFEPGRVALEVGAGDTVRVKARVAAART